MLQFELYTFVHYLILQYLKNLKYPLYSLKHVKTITSETKQKLRDFIKTKMKDLKYLKDRTKI